MIRGLCLAASAIGGLWIAQAVAKQPQDLSPVLVSGLAAYRSHGAAAAVRAWFKDSPAGDDSNMMSETVAALDRIQGAFGPFRGHDFVRTVRLGSRASRTYLILLYERGPLYIYFDTYRAPNEWIVTGFQFNTKPEAILPSGLLGA